MNVRDVAEVIIAFVAAWLFYQGLVMAFSTPMPIVSVVSNSMEPVLHRGDLLVVTNDKYDVGDIVLYQRLPYDRTIVHRIINITESGGYIIKGDNNPAADPGIIAKEEIMGEVKFAVPLLGYPRLALQLVGI